MTRNINVQSRECNHGPKCTDNKYRASLSRTNPILLLPKEVGRQPSQKSSLIFAPLPIRVLFSLHPVTHWWNKGPRGLFVPFLPNLSPRQFGRTSGELPLFNNTLVSGLIKSANQNLVWWKSNPFWETWTESPFKRQDRNVPFRFADTMNGALHRDGTYKLTSVPSLLTPYIYIYCLLRLPRYRFYSLIQ